MSLVMLRLRSQLKKRNYKKLVSKTFIQPNQNYNLFAQQPELMTKQRQVAGGTLNWLTDNSRAKAIVLYFHGGALTAPLNADQVQLVNQITQDPMVNAVIADYPLLGSASSDQILTFATTALTEVATSGLPVILLADSAGAWLVKYLWQVQPKLVAATILISPWLDWQLTSSNVVNLAGKEVLLDLSTMQTIGRQFWQGLTPKQQQLLQQPLGKVGPVQVIVGGHEMLLPVDKQLVTELTLHNSVELLEYPAGFHDFVLWFELPETKKAIQKMAAFIKDQYGV
ncbi:esterase lipase [Lentilactobacillus senioris DSM 24302 = JCM 17472]|uniref:Esterase lipase n=1 Tax=Lentilactobacillus senioris DSM 24302 = JCM 17472 TaxID=1423802 RepID=A0A0R2CTS2_9LACO|nr:alpha/beta hydrolase [Lentilactobacillus senioris]KRM94498.1 esterase lipase [Lentilactobacillus senioris DSM 24302 = JCM 17472]